MSGTSGISHGRKGRIYYTRLRRRWWCCSLSSSMWSTLRACRAAGAVRGKAQLRISNLSYFIPQLEAPRATISITLRGQHEMMDTLRASPQSFMFLFLCGPPETDKP
jgi:hypothetical protein